MGPLFTSLKISESPVKIFLPVTSCFCPTPGGIRAVACSDTPIFTLVLFCFLRAELGKLLSRIDLLIVTRLDRLARYTRNLLNDLHQLATTMFLKSKDESSNDICRRQNAQPLDHCDALAPRPLLRGRTQLLKRVETMEQDEPFRLPPDLELSVKDVRRKWPI
jgi:hypothetical protein